jgi:hypothetical protein
MPPSYCLYEKDTFIHTNYLCKIKDKDFIEVFNYRVE